MIVYFSATGNTQYAAKRLAQLVNDDCLNLLDRIKNNDYSEIHSDKPFVICSPTIICSLPRFFIKYLLKTSFTGNKKVYFMITSGGYAGCATTDAKRICRKIGFEYMGSAEVKMPRNYICSDAYPLLSDDKALQTVKQADIKIKQLANTLLNGSKFSCRYVWLFEKIITYPFVPVYSKIMFKSEKFYTTDKCIGCGKCATLCPFNNINIVDKKPVWSNTCTHCMACIGNCPTKAIEYSNITQSKPRYRFNYKKEEIES